MNLALLGTKFALVYNMISLHPIYIKHDFPSPKLKLVADKSVQEKPKEDRDWLLPIHLESTMLY